MRDLPGVSVGCTYRGWLWSIVEKVMTLMGAFVLLEVPIAGPTSVVLVLSPIAMDNVGKLNETMQALKFPDAHLQKWSMNRRSGN